MRVLLTIVLPLILPTALYLLWLRVGRWPRGGAAMRVRTPPWVWLVGAGVLLLALVLFAITVHFGTPAGSVYVPPQWRNGVIVPGHFAAKAER